MEKVEAISDCLGDSLVEGREAFALELCDLDKGQKQRLVEVLVAEGVVGGDVAVSRGATQGSAQPRAQGPQ